LARSPVDRDEAGAGWRQQLSSPKSDGKREGERV
jgi:hypothetical protein